MTTVRLGGYISGSLVAPSNRHGAITLLVAFLLVVLLAAALFALDVSYINTVTFEARTVADYAARAGGEALSQGKTVTQARDIVKQVGLSNRVAGAPLQIADSDIIFGTAAPNPTTGRYVFTPTEVSPNAVRVFARRTSGSAAGSVALFLGGMFGTGSFEPSKSATACGGPRDIAVVVDRSSSMSDNDAGPPGGPSMTRIAALKISVQQFRAAISGTVDVERIGLYSFDAASRVEHPLSTDYSMFDSKMASMTLGGGTNISAGIDIAAVQLDAPGLRRPEASPVMLVMTDGRWNKGGNPTVAAQSAMAKIPNLTIHTITFSSEAKQSDMKAVAAIGRGRHFHADNVNDLTSVYQTLAGLAAIRLVE
jgi:hypothetical protein